MPEPTDTETLTTLLAAHRFVEHHAGDGYSSPRESWITCTGCPDILAVWSWQQFYAENPTDPEDAKAAHLAAVLTAEGYARPVPAPERPADRDALPDGERGGGWQDTSEKQAWRKVMDDVIEALAETNVSPTFAAMVASEMWKRREAVYAADPHLDALFTADEVVQMADETSDSFGNLYRLDFIDRVRHELALAARPAPDSVPAGKVRALRDRYRTWATSAPTAESGKWLSAFADGLDVLLAGGGEGQSDG